MKDTLINIGPLKIKYYSICILIGILIASLIIYKEAKKKKLNEELLTNLLFYGLIIGILGARIYYVLFNLDYYLQYPQEIIMISHGGLAIHGGIVAALIFIIYYTKKHHINTLCLLDILVVGLIIAQSIGRWGNFFNREAYGRIVSLTQLKKLHIPNFIIKGMYINSNYHEPTFLYESVLSFIGFLLLIILRNTKKLHTGNLTSIYLIWYGIERFFIESLRTDSLMLGNIRIAQLISIIFIISGIIILIFSKNKPKYVDDNIILEGGKHV